MEMQLRLLTGLTRSRSRQATVEEQQPQPSPTPSTSEVRIRAPVGFRVTVLPKIQHIRLKAVQQSELELLQLKQQKLREPGGQKAPFLANFGESSSDHRASLIEAVAATLVFGQEAAGTAVCISSSGLLLTCSHCVAEAATDLDLSKAHWLLFADGCIVQAKCVAWDGRRDLALLQVAAAQDFFGSGISVFPNAKLASSPPKRNSPLLCIGHPGSEDLEAEQSGIMTDYDVLHISRGRYRGLARGQDVHNNSEIGALRHDCWTYWGHSGAPLLGEDGTLVGLHSSWDDLTGMRRGTAWEAVKAFLAEHTVTS